MKKLYTFYFLLLFTSSLWAQIPAGYYDAAAGQSGEALKLALNTIIKGHVEYPYTSDGTDVWDILKVSDRDPNNPDNVILLYTGWSVNAAQEYNNGAGWTREHVWAKSRGDFGTTNGPGTDCHHLRPADVSVNSARNNRWFAECDEQYFDDGGTIPTDSWTSSTEWVWKPRNAVKGDVARMIFYMSTRYEGFDGEPDLEVIDYLPADNLTLEPIHALLSDLLLWNQQDPVDDFERNRNEVVYSYQHNRNPFVDHPEYVEAIWGTVTAPTAPPTTPQNINLTPSSSSLSLSWDDVSSEDGYYVYRSTDNTNFSVLATLAANTLNYDDIDVVEAQTYYYYVIAYNTYGNSAASNTVSGELSVATGGNATDLFFSEYIEGSSYNKALEVSNFTGADLDLSHYVIKKQTNGAGDWSTGYALSGVLANGQSYVVAHSSSVQTILDIADATTTAGEFSFNGNDAVSLWKDGVLIDLIGVFNDATNFAIDVTMIRNSDVASPNVIYTPSEWTNYAIDYFADLGTHTFDGVVVEPTCDVPGGLSVSNITTNAAELNWAAVAGAVDYSVQYKETVASSWTTVIAGTNTLSISGLTPETQYEFQVATSCSAASSTYSTAISFATEAEIITPTCDVPTGLFTSNITTNAADLNWTTIADAVEYNVQYKETSASSWTTVIAGTNALSISGLTPNTQYEFQVATSCSATSSLYSMPVSYTTLAEIITVNYCEPLSGTRYEWINFVELTNVSNTSGQSATGYSDFTNLIADIGVGQTYPITFQAGFLRKLYTEYWTVWIDFNQDGDFDDAGERLAQGSTTDNGLYYMDLLIPANAPLGETRLRIAINDAGYFDACYSAKYGETEDYTVNIGLAKASFNNNNLNAQKAEFMEPQEFAVYPNPTNSNLYVKHIENTQIEIYAVTGQRVYDFNIENDHIDVSKLKSGIYFMRIDNGDKIKTHRFIKK